MKPFTICLILFLAIFCAVGLAWPVAALTLEEPVDEPAVNQSVAESDGVRYELIADEFAYGFENTAHITARITNISGSPKSFPWPCRDYFSAQIKNGDTLIQNLNSEACEPENELAVLQDGGALVYTFEWPISGGGDAITFATYTVNVFPIEPSIQSAIPLNIRINNLSNAVCKKEDGIDRHTGSLRLSIWTEKQRYKKGEPILVYVNIKNIDDRPFELRTIHPFYDVIISQSSKTIWGRNQGFGFDRAGWNYYFFPNNTKIFTHYMCSDGGGFDFECYNLIWKLPLEVYRNGYDKKISDLDPGLYEAAFTAFRCDTSPSISFEIVEN